MTDSSKDARVAQLREATERKSADSRARARRAIMSLETGGKPINFNTVAAEGKVSKTFLYANADIRRLITDRRRPPAATIDSSPRARNTRNASAEAKLAVATTAIQRLKAENKVLRDENARLQGDLLQMRRDPRRSLPPIALLGLEGAKSAEH